MIFRCFKFVFFMMLPSVALAGPFTMSYEGYLTDNFSVPITGSQNFVFTISGSSAGNSPGGACLLYTETDNSVAVTNGNVGVEIGQNLGTIHGGYSSLDKIFARASISGSGCTFSAGNADATWTMGVSVNGTALGNVSLNAAPRAMQAQNSYSTEKIQGYTVSASAPSNGQVLKYNSGIWSPSSESVTSETDPTVSAFAKGTTLGAGLVNSASVVSLKTCANGEMLLYNTSGPSWDCTAPGGGGLSTTLAAGKIYVGNVSNVATAIAMGGDATMNASGSMTLADTGVTAGTYSSVTVDTKGRITTGVNPIIATAKGGTGLSAIGTANQILGVTTSGTSLEYKTLTAGTNVTISPGAGTLTINASGGVGDFLKDGSVAMTGNLQLYNSTLYGSSTSSGVLNLDSTSHPTKGTIKINPSGGDVIIGSTPSNSILTVTGTSTSFQGYKALNAGSGTTANAGIILGNDISSSAGALTLGSSNYTGLGGVGSLGLATYTAAPLVLGTNNTPRITIDSTGNVGIGTTSPGNPLDVNGIVSVRNGSGRTNLKGSTTGVMNFQFPSSVGINGYILQTDGTGVTSWVAPGGGLSGTTTGSSNYLTTLGVNAGATGPSGASNTLIGGQSGFAMTTGQANTAVGHQALYSTTSGSYNTVLGYAAGAAASTIDGNTIIGANAGNGTTGAYNVIMGYAAGQGTNAGGNNVILGYGAAPANAGSFNVVLGSNAGGATLNGANNIAIGQNTTFSGSVNNSIAIGFGVTASLSNMVAIGNSTQTLTRLNGSTATGVALSVGTSTSNGNGANLTTAGTWTNTSDRRIKHHILDLTYGLGELMKLRPVQYEMIGTDEKQIGFIAQEVYEVVPEVVVKPPTEEGRWTMSYGNLTSLAIKSIQEQQREISSLKEENSQLRAVLCKYHPEEEICH